MTKTGRMVFNSENEMSQELQDRFVYLLMDSTGNKGKVFESLFGLKSEINFAGRDISFDYPPFNLAIIGLSALEKSGLVPDNFEERLAAYPLQVEVQEALEFLKLPKVEVPERDIFSGELTDHEKYDLLWPIMAQTTISGRYAAWTRLTDSIMWASAINLDVAPVDAAVLGLHGAKKWGLPHDFNHRIMNYPH